MKFDHCQKNRAIELLLSANRGSRVKACAVASHWPANTSDGKYF